MARKCGTANAGGSQVWRLVGARARPVRAAGAREGGGCGAKQRVALAEGRGEGQQRGRVGVGVPSAALLAKMAKSSFYSCDNEL